MARVCLFTVMLGGALWLDALQAEAQNPRLTLDEFFDSVQIRAVKLSPDGQSVVIQTVRADWEQNRFRSDLWLYRDEGDKGGSLVRLTQSGRDRAPDWSPTGQWVAFLSDRRPQSSPGAEHPAVSRAADQLYIISPQGGEAFQITSGEEGVHAFAWSADSRTIYFATRFPWS